MIIEQVFSEKKDCCGCGACVALCPTKALTLHADAYGFLFPQVDSTKCIGCGNCRKVCAFGKSDTAECKQAFAMANRSKEALMSASSGGVFGAVALPFLNNGGVVCGASMDCSMREVEVRHTIAHTAVDLQKLYGSKYVQSLIPPKVYSDIRKLLQDGTDVLFTGTPCQVSQLQSLFGHSEHFFAIDIICHGVPNQRMLNDYLRIAAKGKKISNIVFRDKKKGWGLNGTISYVCKEEQFSPQCASYYGNFLNGHIYRECCYSCPYANLKRTGDLTIGDYWGAQKFNPEILTQNGGCLDEHTGISCALVNTEKGKVLLDVAAEGLISYEVSIEDVAVVNSQLREPVKCTEMHDRIMDTYVRKGYPAVDRLFWRQLRLLKLKYWILSLLRKC